MSTGIAWCDETLNAIETYDQDGTRGWHCERVSRGCDNCYAEGMNRAQRFMGTGLPYVRSSRDKVTFKLNVETLRKPSRWTRRRSEVIFWEDMSDLFGEWIPDEWIDLHAAAVMLSPRHRHIWLTKRPERMRAYFGGHGTGVSLDRGIAWLDAVVKLKPEANVDQLAHITNGALDNLILATTIESQKEADRRVPELLATPAAVRMVSIEPQLGPVDIRLWLGCEICRKPLPCDCGFNREDGIGWVIQGGESGHNARPFDIQWACDMRDQCAGPGVPYFLKQLGARPTERTDGVLTWPELPLKSPAGSDPAEWPEDLRVRQWPAKVASP